MTTNPNDRKPKLGLGYKPGDIDRAQPDKTTKIEYRGAAEAQYIRPATPGDIDRS